VVNGVVSYFTDGADEDQNSTYAIDSSITSQRRQFSLGVIALLNVGRGVAYVLPQLVVLFLALVGVVGAQESEQRFSAFGLEDCAYQL
jgi:predicted ATPase